jgi:DGQHR domain-containing protein
VVNAFVAEHVDVQREQFLRVNSTKPLPRGLITELLPEVDGIFPPHLASRRVPSALCGLLNADPESPFRGLIRRSSAEGAQRRQARIADAAIVQMIHDSLSLPKGCLFTYKNAATGSVDVTGVRKVLITFWTAVAAEFPEAWGLPPTQSRLMHGAGIRAMGRVMDYVMRGVDVEHPRAQSRVRREVGILRPACRWTQGTWEILNNFRWNEVQNVSSHVRALGEALVRTYLQRRKDQ